MIAGRAPLLLLLVALARGAGAQVLDARAVLARQMRASWWDNRDTAWFAGRVPIFESPDPAIDATYYYRWELVTKHLTYGAPETGYTFTEFIDRPFWSGAYGAISCPLGHQAYEVRWLDDRRIVDDFAHYWFEAPGAQPRSYSNWYGDAMWATYLVLGDTAFLRGVYPYMRRQYAGWVAEHFDSAHGLFRWDGLHDGMERNIDSRQTTDIDAGAEGYRPTLNSYLYADARAIARAAALFGDADTARVYAARAAALRARVLAELWDPRRRFFLHQFAHDEPGGVRAGTRTYETGRYAGDPHGRELIGYVPWQFDLPPADAGYEVAWARLRDTASFAAPFGPTTAERHDPLFYVSPTCCWWSGNSWPYATTQTLVALANLLNDYRQDIVTKQDYFDLLATYTRTQRLGGRRDVPYVAEAANPDDGSWKGHDTPSHSEHYFHSGYVDLVITGLVGLRPRADDTLEVNPLAPDAWPYFALDGVAYHGHRVAVVWDRDGTRYRHGRGLSLWVDGAPVAHAPALGRLVAAIGPPRPPTRVDHPLNLAVNNGRGAYPWIEASYSAPTTPPYVLLDGNYRYTTSPPNRWTAAGSPNARDTLTLDFGVARPVERLALYFLDDGDTIAPPRAYAVETWNGRRWVPARGTRDPARPAGRRPNVYAFARTASTSRLRVVLTHRPGTRAGLTELEAWAHAPLPLPAPTAPPRNLAAGAVITASFTGRSDQVEEVADNRIAFTRYSRNRWTAYGSPNASDWVQVDFGAPVLVRAVALYLWGDDRGVRAPRRYTVQFWDGTRWVDARETGRFPAAPTASAVNTVRLVPTRAARLRVVFEHDRPAVAGMTELVVSGER